MSQKRFSIVFDERWSPSKEYAEAIVSAASSRKHMTMRREWARAASGKSHLRNQKGFHSRYNFGYGILLYMRKCPFTAHFGGFEGDFSYKNDKSATLCPGKT